MYMDDLKQFAKSEKIENSDTGSKDMQSRYSDRI